MPPKKKTDDKQRKSLSQADSRATVSEGSGDVKLKKEKTKPLTKRERENMKKQEKAMRERIIQLRKEADQLLAELKETEEAARKKAENETNMQTKRIDLLTGTIENFKFAKDRLLHEHNKLREKEIWDRYINTNQMPYPEDCSNMHTHLYLWKAHKSFELIDNALPKCDSYMEVFDILDDLIDHPIFAEKETVDNWKETRADWRNKFFHTMDKACFNMIKNLEANFDKETGDDADVYTFEDETDHIQLAVIGWLQSKDNTIPRSSPKISIQSMNVHIVMPATYRKDPFVLRVLYLDADFLSDSSLTFSCPEGLPMETNMLDEVKRCFTVKSDAKASVADREREKVRVAKQKVTEAQAAAQSAEKNFESMMQKTKKGVVPSDDSAEQVDIEEEKVYTKKKKPRDFTVLMDTANEIGSSPFTGRRPKNNIFDDGGESVSPKSLMQSVGTQRALDAISMRSGMRKKVQARMKRSSRASHEEGICTNVFSSPSMISISDRRRKVEIRKDSELCFEQPDDDGDSKSEVTEVESEASFDSLELMFGREDDDDVEYKSIKTLVRHTKIVNRDKQKTPHSKSMFSAAGKTGRKRGKSIGSIKRLADDSDEIQQTASDIYESKEELRQENYMSSFVFTDIPNRRVHVNLRAFSTIGGVYFLDTIFHESQPKTLKNGDTVQIFYGEHNIKRMNYEYEYVPPPPPPESDDPNVVAPVDPGLQHLLLVKVPLPENVVFVGSKPIIALWDREQKYWTKQHVYQCEIDLVSKTATFKLGRIWPFAFLINKFALFSLKKWVVKPKFDTCGVCIMVQTQDINFQFCVMNSEVCLHSVEGLVQISAIEDFVGVYMHVNKLVKIMKSRGLNLFPDKDSFLYINDNTSKDPVLEDHAYLSMAMFSDTLEFQSSQWNFDCKRRKLSFQVRECLAYNLELRLRTVTTGPLSAALYRCSDEENMDDSKLDNLGFCPDVYSLLEKAFAHATPTTALNPLQVITVYSLLSRLKVLSYCGYYKKETTSSSSDTSKNSPKKRSKKSGKPPRGKYKFVGSRSSQASISILTEM